jgi:hypothetical protein
MWSMIEPALAITAGNLAVIRPLLRKLGLRNSTKVELDPLHVFPPTIGAQDRNKGKKGSQDSLFTLSTTLVNGTAIDRGNSSEKETKHSQTVSVSSSNTAHSIWEGRENGSQEELHSKTTKDSAYTK